MTIPPDKSPDKISGGKPLEPPDKQIVPGKGASSFDSYMQGTGQAKMLPQGTPATAGGPAPMGIITQRPSIQASGVSFDSLLGQAKTAKDSLGTVEKQLGDQNLKLKRSQSHLVRQKLDDANSYIRASGSKLGVQAPPLKMPSGASPIARFLAMVNDGQDQLMQVQQQLKDLAAKGESLNPGEMMSVQVKMSLAQQEIDYTSSLLSKVITSTTQILNTQL